MEPMSSTSSVMPNSQPSRAGTMYTRRCTSTTVPRSGGVKPYSQLAIRGFLSSSVPIMGYGGRSCGGPLVLAAPAPRGEHHARVLGVAEAAVIAAERAEIVAFLHIQIVTQDDAAVAQVGAQVKQIVGRAAEELRPEGHHLHVAARSGGRHRVFAKRALHFEHTEHQLWIEPGARRLVVNRAQKLDALLSIRHPLRQAPLHVVQPAVRILGGAEGKRRHRLVGDRR